MKILLLSVFLAAAVVPLVIRPVIAGETQSRSSDQPPGAVLIVVARSGRQGEAADRIVDELTRALGPSQSVQIIRFDAESTARNDHTIQGANQDLIVVDPYTPMKGATETGLRTLMTIPGQRSMVVIASDQLYPSGPSTDSLWQFARQQEIHIYTIHLAFSDNAIGIRRFGRRLRKGISGAFKRGPEQPAQSARDTRRFLHFMADTTDGKACAANDENTEIAAAHAIADEILNASDREPNSGSRCVSWDADLSQN